ncbi:putative LRR receptor-like serine/threonine-protein kinase At1g05700 [Wolffia australiana]
MLFLAGMMVLLFTVASAQSTSSADFISIDCGLGVGKKYTDADDGILYVADEPYTSTGVNFRVRQDINSKSDKPYYANVRSFPDGIRNCYTLAPVSAGLKYRVEAEFLYGNYDGLRVPPTFDLYLGVNIWKTVTSGNFTRAEIIFVAVGDSVQVCLVNTGDGTPFISYLNLRPISSFKYSLVSPSLGLLVNWDRRNFGATSQIRYPQDPYDRGWYPFIVGKPIANNSTVTQVNNNEFVVPPALLQTAVTTSSVTENLIIPIPGSSNETTFVIMYFAELQQLPAKEIREFNIYAGDDFFYGPLGPAYLRENVIYTRPTGVSGGLTFSLRSTSNSTLPPLINAMEALVTRPLPFLPTNNDEVTAMLEMKKLFKVNKNWEGDPCLPQKLIWQGVECSLDSSKYSRISTLNLSQSGYSGPIPAFLSSFKYLTSLDMSYNNITGEIPPFVAQLPALNYLNLEGNNLTGDIPQALMTRSQNGQLVLRINNNPMLCSRANLCDTKDGTKRTKKNKVIIPVAVAVSAFVLLVMIVALAVFTLKRRQAKAKATVFEVPSNSMGQKNSNIDQENILHSESQIYSLSDITNITNNFERPIGKGGFGTVYHGYLQNGVQVAVKIISQLSAEGEKQFRAEAQLLTRVHHKYLVSLLGYCKENLALVYEFLSRGSLADHLSDNSADKNTLNWDSRLRIAVEAAQGLDYLHNGCKPSIIHRDVKAANILLNDCFEAKLADFGLSRSYKLDDGNSHISTCIAGTPGYIDPACFMTNRMNETSDIYSFGIVLLEIITGNPPITFDDYRIHITEKVQMKIKCGDIESIVDQRIQGQYDVNAAWKFAEIALACTSPNQSERPSISDVVVQLKECQLLQGSSDSCTDPTYIAHNSVNSATPYAR